MPSPHTRVRVAGAVALAAAASIVVAMPAPAARPAVAVDPTKISAAAEAARTARSTLATASASKAQAEQAVSAAAAAVKAAEEAQLAAREQLSRLHERVADATEQRLAVQDDGGLLDVAADATDAATGESDSTVVDAVGTAVTAGFAGVVGPIIGAVNPLDDAVDEQLEGADQVLAEAKRHERALRIERAGAARAARVARGKVSDAVGLRDAATAAFVGAQQKEQDAAAVSASAAAAAKTFAASLAIDKRLVMPGLGGVSSPYGMRTHPVTGVHKLHSGTDFERADGKAYAAAAGTVAAVTRDSAYGNMVTIAHGKGITTRYAHLAKPLVEPGDRIAAGQVIGKIGSTGLSTGPHLHFEVQVNGQFQNPADWLAR
jgi:murein DD-endopeptidase MepM/ murein hydrolase activator NlpD